MHVTDDGFVAQNTLLGGRRSFPGSNLCEGPWTVEASSSLTEPGILSMHTVHACATIPLLQQSLDFVTS